MYNLDSLYSWFMKYTKDFYTTDVFVMAGIEHKVAHSLRVANNAAELADALGLKRKERRLAEAIGLCHDVGRFIQYSKYRTFNDALSVDHGELSITELEREGILSKFSLKDCEILDFAIRYHNKLSFPEVGPEFELFANIIRDADKLDIFRCLPSLTVGHDYSPVLVELLKTGGALPYTKVKTAADRRLIRVGWLLDVNFSWTLSNLREEGHVGKLLAELPDDENFRDIKAIIRDYIYQKTFAVY